MTNVKKVLMTSVWPNTGLKTREDRPRRNLKLVGGLSMQIVVERRALNLGRIFKDTAGWTY